MSLSNLANVCSHLQNASMARLGLTSIVYTKLHLAFALVLQKQGFISQVKLAGSTPPLSAFAPGVRNELRPQLKSQDRKNRQNPLLTYTTVNGGDGRPGSENLLTDSEMEFLLTHYQKSKDELEELLSSSISSLQLSKNVKGAEGSLTLQPADIEKSIEVVETHRRLVKEAERLVQTRDGNTDALYDLVARVLQPGNHKPVLEEGAEAGSSASEKDPDQEGVVTQANRASRRLWLGMKYWNGEPVLSRASMVSKPKKPLTLNLLEINKILSGKTAKTVKPLSAIGEIMVLKTSEGVIDAREAVDRHVGGMVLCRVS